jgi:radical SAM protein with 4Fe4S-binding SPASM domain
MDMSISRLAILGLHHGRNAIAEEVYLKTGYDATMPITFYALVNERCNLKCRYCDSWRMPHYVNEMTIKEWQHALTSVKDFVGAYMIGFCGGEPFVKHGFTDLLSWCHRNGVSASVTTNGTALTKRNCEKIVAAKPFNFNISIDAPMAEVNDHLRGHSGLLAMLTNGIRCLIEEREKQGVFFPIIIKPTVNVQNFRYLPQLVEWTRAIGATSLNLQPMYRRTPETYDELWIEEADIPELERIIDQLIELKQNGAPILNSEAILALIPDHFREKKAPAEVMPCRVGLRDFFIYPDGRVYMCDVFAPIDDITIGNIKEQSAREIWYGPKAADIRKRMIVCEKLCLNACLSQKTMADKVKMGLKLLAPTKKWPSSAAPSATSPTP